MQGQWYADGDPESMFTVLGSEKYNTYDGAYVGTDYLAMVNTCNTYEGGPFLAVTDAGINDVLCYAIEDLSDNSMTWMYLARGNFHVFRRLD